MKKKHLIGPFMPNHEDFNGTSRQAFLLFRIHVYHKADDSSKQILRLLKYASKTATCRISN